MIIAILKQYWSESYVVILVFNIVQYLGKSEITKVCKYTERPNLDSTFPLR